MLPLLVLLLQVLLICLLPQRLLLPCLRVPLNRPLVVLQQLWLLTLGRQGYIVLQTAPPQTHGIARSYAVPRRTLHLWLVAASFWVARLDKMPSTTPTPDDCLEFTAQGHGEWLVTDSESYSFRIRKYPETNWNSNSFSLNYNFSEYLKFLFFRSHNIVFKCSSINSDRERSILS